MTDATSYSGLCLWIAQPGAGNALKHYLARYGVLAGRRFSHASLDTTLHPELSVLDNLLIAMEESDFSGNDSAKEAFVSQRLETHQLRALASWFQNPRRKVHQLTSQERLVAAVCFALLNPAQQSFVELSLASIEPLCWLQLKKALIEKSRSRHITVQLQEASLWQDHETECWDLTAAGLIARAA